MQTQHPSDSARRDVLASLPPEHELLVRAARTADVDVDRLRALASSDSDWDRIVELASATGVAPLVSRSLSEHCADAVPDDALETFRAVARQTATANLQTASELPRVVDALAEGGVDALTYRGAALAEDGYDDLGLRQFGDIDLLVRREEIPRAKAILEDLGYEPAYQRDGVEELSSGQSWAYRRLCRDYPFQHSDRRVEVELHWRVVGLQFPTNIQLDGLWDRRTTTTVAGRSVPVPSPEDRLLAMCVHGTRHRWERLSWICDVAEFCRRHDVDWEATLERARMHRAERMFLLGAALARDFYGLDFAPRVDRAIAADDELAQIRSTVIEGLFKLTELDPLELRRFHRRTLSHRADAFRFYLHWLLKPRRRSIESVSLPIHLAWFYVLLRPLSLLKYAVYRFLGRDVALGDVG